MDEAEWKVPYYRNGPLVGENEEESEWISTPASWVAFLAMRQEIRDPQVHQLLQKDLVEYLCGHKGDV